MSDTLTARDGPRVGVSGRVLGFSRPRQMWSRGGDEDEYQGPPVDGPGLLLALVHDIDGPLSYYIDALNYVQRLRPLNVFDVESLVDPDIDPELIQGVKFFRSGQGAPIYGAYYAERDAALRRATIAEMRDIFDLALPPKVSPLLELPLQRRAAILRHYPIEVDMDELELWEAVDDSISHIDD